ncbi:3-keto-5-aminohexanoate cleavage protein [Ramlibacter albus]|uniref:3-keto-5-aminohexanoate cleavage protein n=1 Tax=Ramlibacter albus TaxID=2079448 RepID=A0A923M7J1_9BURK|nr:3-keto-5-aminohexanoate cleavage protein [Ramlibacter albus]MBC5765702.1 3-keto-5-aminohexanoate cleavage protein [Ramlibacter albus]
MPTEDARPVLIEVAINGARDKRANPHVPLAEEEIVDSILACVEAGASIVHAHAGEAVVGGSGHHGSSAYLRSFRRVREFHPSLLMYPTLPGGGPGTTMAARLGHVAELADAGLCEIVPVDPGTMNYGRIDAQGRAPTHDQVYQTTFADVAWAFEFCRERDLACTMSLFEPGFARLVQAHANAGTLPRACIVKLEFSAGARLFGLSPDAVGLEAWLRLFDSETIPWMVTLRDGSPADGLAQLAIGRGGHVRVGIEDFGGERTPRNEELVAEIARIARASGRRVATPQEALGLITRTQGDKA